MSPRGIYPYSRQFPVCVRHAFQHRVTTLLIALFLFALLSSGPIAVGQATSGTITGNVTDPSGAVIPNATVTIVDMDRGTQYTTTSNSEGLFLRTQLPNGRYEVKVEAQGFNSFDRQNIAVDIDRETRVYAQLGAGQVSQSVTVSANAEPALITDRAEISTTLDSHELTQLPTLSQNVTQLELLSPGTVPNTYNISTNENPQSGLANNTNGLLFGFTNRQIDGADDMDAVLGIEVVNPPPQSLDQMKATTSNYDAEFGRSGGAVIQYVTKSGSNSFHGGVFEFLRNNYFNARNPYTERTLRQPLPLRFNQFGGTLGGPIVKNKLFFFFTYQGQRQRLGSGVITTVPTLAARGGDLSAYSTPSSPISLFAFNPATNTRTPLGSVVPTALINPAAANLLALLPAPNLPGLVDNFDATGSTRFDTNQYDGRIDYFLGNNDRLFVRYDYFGSDIRVPSAFGNIVGGPSTLPGFGNGLSLGRNQNLAVNYNHVFSANWLMNVRYSYFRYRINVEPNDVGLSTASQIGIPGINLGTSDTSGLSNFTFNGSALLNNTSGQAFQLGTSIGTNAPLHEQEQLHQGSASVSRTWGNHNLKFGGDYRWVVNLRRSSDTSQRGVFNFTSAVTGSGGASSTGGDAFASFLLGQSSSFSRFAFFGNPKEYEWDVFGFIQDQFRVTPKLTLTYGLRYEVYSAPYANRGNGANFDLNSGVLRVANTGGIDRYMGINTRLNNFAPRLGFAYSVNPKTVLRAGYGRSYFPNFFSIQVSHNYPVNFSQNVTSAATDVPVGFTLTQGPPAPTPPVVPATGVLFLPTNVSATGIPLNRKTASVDMYNVAIQREIANNFTVQVAYVGNQARHLYAFLDANDPVPGPGDASMNRPYFRNFGYTQSITDFCNCFSSNYNSGQVTAEKRFSRGYALTAQYTYSKVLNYGDNAAEFGPYDIPTQYGPAGFDRTHAFSLGHVLDIPVGPGRTYFTNMNTAERLALAGWQFTGVTTAYSGRPFTPVLSSNASLNSTYNLRPNQIGDPHANVPAGLAFNPAAYAQPAPFVAGDAGRNSLRGPNYVQADWQLGKAFIIKEGVDLNFAWQNFNVFNHPNRSVPNNVISNANPADTSNGVGQFTSLENNALPRTMQFSLSLNF